MSWRFGLLGTVLSLALAVWGCSSEPTPAGDDDDDDNGTSGSGGTTGTSCSPACGAGQSCVAGACVCQTGLSACGSSCIDTMADASNCGACGTPCAQGLFCSLGTCSSSCAGGLTACGQSCVNVASSVAHCGTCNNACPSGLNCGNGTCACPNGQSLCSGTCADTSSNVSHCGACGVPCGSGQSCVGGVCSGGSSSGGMGGMGGMGAGGSAGSAGTGSGGMSGAGGSGTPTGIPGVVLADDAGTLGCVPLCRNPEHTDDTDTTDDWAYEGFACVLPDSPTGTRNQACTTGEALPAINRNGLPGVVVDAGEDPALDCVPLCEVGAMPSSTDSTDWGWEYQASCIIRDTVTSMCNQGCTTGQPIPPATMVQRGGVLIDDACTALCECMSAGDDPNWGWEFQSNCVMPGTEPATDKVACTTNDSAPLVPPAVTGATHDGFYVESGKLKDAKGNDFVMRGVNNPHGWFDTGNQYRAYQALDAIAGYKTNTIRVVWETALEGGTPTLLRRVLARIVELKMVPMVELHDVTGDSDAAGLNRMATYYAQADVKQVLIDFRAYVLINIANEWSGSDGSFVSAYTTAINTIRSAGLEHTLVIDANAFGQNAGSVLNNAAALLNADPEHNLLFSVHMYSQYGSNAQVDAVLGNSAVGSTVPLIVGEFGPQLQGTNVAWQQIMAKCQERGIGYLAWSWSGNDSMTANLNIVNDWAGALTPNWGQQVMVSNANSIQNTAQKASIFP